MWGRGRAPPEATEPPTAGITGSARDQVPLLPEGQDGPVVWIEQSRPGIIVPPVISMRHSDQWTPEGVLLTTALHLGLDAQQGRAGKLPRLLPGLTAPPPLCSCLSLV